jgi:hypothetical protein
MNTQNVGSLEACKRLVDAGIVLETEKVWIYARHIALKSSPPSWMLVTKSSVMSVTAAEKQPLSVIPAPCFTDVWRELPWVIDNYGLISMNKVDNITCCGYRKGMAIREPKFESENPTDALIELLIWVKGEEK